MGSLARETIRAGRLRVIAPDGQLHSLEGPAKGPEASIRIADQRLLRRMLIIPDLYLGEAYVQGSMTIESGSLCDVLDFFACNLMPRVHDTDAAPPVASVRSRTSGGAMIRAGSAPPLVGAHDHPELLPCVSP